MRGRDGTDGGVGELRTVLEVEGGKPLDAGTECSDASIGEGCASRKLEVRELGCVRSKVAKCVVGEAMALREREVGEAAFRCGGEKGEQDDVGESSARCEAEMREILELVAEGGHGSFVEMRTAIDTDVGEPRAATGDGLKPESRDILAPSNVEAAERRA